MRFLASTFSVTLLLAACGADVVHDEDAGSVGASSSSGTGSGGGLPSNVCGGPQRVECGPDAWCQWDSPGSCGEGDSVGTCQPKPTSCSGDVMPVCGCDGLSHDSACEANQGGSDVGTCDLKPGYTGAYLLPTTPPRFVLATARYEDDRCFFLILAQADEGISAIQTTMGWRVEHIGITPRAKDCEPLAVGGSVWPLPPDTVETETGKGTISQDLTWPCYADAELSVTFPAGSPAWVPNLQALQKTSISVIGGVCDG
jgi:hypothetical protein